MSDNDERTGTGVEPAAPTRPEGRQRRVFQRRALGRTPLDRPRRVFESGWLRIDFDAYEVYVAGRPVQLFLREFELLCFFVQWPNRVFDRGEIIESIWGDEAAIDPRTVDVHVRRLRALVERNPAEPELIVTVRRVGYKFDDRVLRHGEAGALSEGTVAVR